MEVIATNVGERQTVAWKGKSVETGIFKKPVSAGVTLETTDVRGDAVVDRKYHGGVDKACYLYSADTYTFWKEKYPSLDWDWGMFGENLTVEGLDEHQVCIGDVYQLGEAEVEVSEPRQPCFKLGIRFGTQQVLKDFIAYGHSGVYVRVIKEGKVHAGDKMTLVRKGSDVSIWDVFQMIYKKEQDQQKIERAVALPKLAESTRKHLQQLL
ncbi:MOSC domain-containing protein [Marinoscillum furvescens]|uniref:MOSC domain-containing protein YiiM n=1 Tax=Marinoscillum furvescens DSM 4134 TaxID=1122208 RepID=A0A3D9L5Y1_MARFU|nr:MOSC domain-containing protein [Marinoscillum furvescens]REE01494.1 MOSC domain-containing protein YiiM [Marinoscillum furvescens DSM 4134]